MNHLRAFLLVGIILPAWSIAQESEPEKPLATLAVISNPYISTLPPDQIKDETGTNRGFLAKSSPAALEKAVAIVNQLQPDALIVIGSLTWSGSKADFDKANSYLEKLTVPNLIVPGPRDDLGDQIPSWRKQLGDSDATDSIREVAGVRLIFSSKLHSNPVQAASEISAKLESASSHHPATLLIDTHATRFTMTKLNPAPSAFWDLIDQQKIATLIEPTRYGYQHSLTNNLPRWKVGSTGWSSRGAITRIRVFSDRIELGQFSDPERLAFSLTIPNPVTAPRLALVEDDPHACLSYTAELAKKPDYTVALISDPQFDRESNRQTLIDKAKAGVADLNRLNPDLVFITGDLVNNNLPEEWELFNSIFAELKPPRHVVPGNHDVLFNYNFVEASYSSAPTKKPEYAEIVKKALAEAEKEGFTGPTALYEKYTGSPPRQLIEFKDSAFITVPFLTMRADPEQVEYLRTQLERAKDKRHLFVAAHYPCLPFFGNNVLPDRGGREVLSLLKEHKVTGFLFGHRHRNGFAMFDNTAHILTDNMSSIHLLHVHPDHIIVGRKRIGGALYETLTIPSPRSNP